jgi:hypothetical protein
VSQLPRAPDTLGFYIIKKRGDNPNLPDLKTSKDEILKALLWL